MFCKDRWRQGAVGCRALVDTRFWRSSALAFAAAMLAGSFAARGVAAESPAATVAAEQEASGGALAKATSGAAAGGAKAAAEEHDMEMGVPKSIQGPEEFKTDLAIWTFVVFLVLLGILTKFAWGPIVAGLQKREEGIAANIAAAQRTHDEAKQLLVEYDKKLAGAADQVRQMLDAARRDAEQTKLDIIAEAKAAAQLEQQRGVREVRTAVDQALKELSEKSTNLAVDLAGRIVRSKLNPADHARLAQEAIAEFAASKPSVN
jgi:F-type H+-transporting ATPase subunit b